MGSNPVESPEFFRFLRQLLKLSSRCEDHIFIWHFIHFTPWLFWSSLIWCKGHKTDVMKEFLRQRLTRMSRKEISLIFSISMVKLMLSSHLSRYNKLVINISEPNQRLGAHCSFGTKARLKRNWRWAADLKQEAKSKTMSKHSHWNPPRRLSASHADHRWHYFTWNGQESLRTSHFHL